MAEPISTQCATFISIPKLFSDELKSEPQSGVIKRFSPICDQTTLPSDNRSKPVPRLFADMDAEQAATSSRSLTSGAERSRAERSNAEMSNAEMSNAEPSDAELWVALKQGQVNALGMLYDRHVGLVYGIALKTMRNPQDAEDLTQEVFLQLAKTNYDPRRGSLRTFLAILTRSRSLDGLRSRRRAQASLQHWQTGQHQDSLLPLETLDQQERVQEVQAALSQLSEEQQRVLHLAYQEGLSQTAIAERLGSPLGTVKAWARRGLLKLRQNLQDVFEDR